MTKSKDLTTLANVLGRSAEYIASILGKSVATRGLKFEELLELHVQLANYSKAERKVEKLMLRKAVSSDELITVRNCCSDSIRTKATKRVVQQINTLPELERLYSNVLNSYDDKEAIKQRMLQVITTPSEAEHLLYIFGEASIDIRLMQRWNELSIRELQKISSLDQVIDLRFSSYRVGGVAKMIDQRIVCLVKGLGLDDAMKAYLVVGRKYRGQVVEIICAKTSFNQAKELVLSEKTYEGLRLAAWYRMLDEPNFNQTFETYEAISYLPIRMKDQLQSEALIRLMERAPDKATQREVFNMAYYANPWLEKKLIKIARSRLS